MKKLLLLAALAAFSLGGVFAQQSNSPRRESEYYYVNVPIEKIYLYRLGYIVVYRSGVNQMARVCIPLNWFTDTDGKGELVGLGTGSEWPSMSVYYRNGEFSHVRLRVRRSKAHETWGVVPLNINIDDYFTDVQEVRLQL